MFPHENISLSKCACKHKCIVCMHFFYIYWDTTSFGQKSQLVKHLVKHLGLKSTAHIPSPNLAHISSMRLCQPPDGSTSPKYKLLCFITTKIFFAKRRTH